MKYLAIFILSSWVAQSTGPQCTDIIVVQHSDTLTYEMPTKQAAQRVICDQLQNIGSMGGEGKVLTNVKLDSNLVQE